MAPMGSDRARVTSLTATRSAGVSSSPVPSSPRSRAVPRATLTTSDTSSMVPIPASRLPPPRSRPRTGSLTHPDAGPLPEEAQPGLLLAGEQGDRDIPAPARSGRGAWCRWPRRGGRPWPAPPPRRRPRRPPQPGADAPSAPPRRPGRQARPRSAPLRSRGAGTSVGAAPGSAIRRSTASTTIRWNELLPRSKTATRTVGIGVTLPGTVRRGKSRASRWPTLGRSCTGRVDGRHHGT